VRCRVAPCKTTTATIDRQPGTAVGHLLREWRAARGLSQLDLELRLFSTIMTLGTPQDVTLQELRIETLFPAEAEHAKNVTIWLGKIFGGPARR
jgi:hypothetical protein